MAFQVTFRDPSGNEEVVSCEADEYLLDAAETEGVDVESSCRAGACSTCACKVLSGTVDQSEQSFLSSELMDQGFVLTCVAKPTSDCVILTEQAEEF